MRPSQAPKQAEVTKTSKDEQIAQIRDRFSRASSAVLLNFRGLTVAKATDLRNEFRKVGVDFKVVKNSLVKLAIKDTNLDTAEFRKALIGETAIAWTYEDPSLAAKVIKEARKDDVTAQRLTVKAGVLESQVLAAERVESELATMPGKDELRAMLLATFMAPAQKLVMQLMAPGQNLAFALDARKRQLEGNG
ncbi:MAG TPA: 50S ribosomal protein L10 [Polyangiales bacterium]|nr:50S ribosomal protein L10 [Polyangiales bacterium]